MTLGLTGNIGAGKSTVRQHLSARPNLETFDADACVHRLLASQPQVASEIRTRFGPEFLNADNTPNRDALREHVFRNPEARHTLEAILHPMVRAEWQAQAARSNAAGRHFLADIPLLYETDSEASFDAVVVVACSPEIQWIRLLARGLAPETAQAMLASQLPIGQKIARASFVLWNDGSLPALHRQTDLVANLIFSA